MIRRPPVLQCVLVATLAALAGFAFASSFRVSDLLVPVLGAAILPVVVSASLRLRRSPHMGVSVVATVIAFVVFATAAVFPDTAVARLVPTGASVEAMRAGLTDGWRQLLGSLVPASPRPSLLFVPTALTWVAAFVSIEVALRTRSRLGPMVAPVAAAVTGLMMGSGASGRWGWPVVAFTIAALALLALRSQDAQADPMPFDRRVWTAPPTDAVEARAVQRAVRRQRLLTAVPTVIVVALVGGAVADRLPGIDADDAFSLRDHVVVEQEQRQYLSPLAMLGDDSGPSLRVTLDRVPPTGSRFPLVVLDRYDGQGWTAGGTFVDAGVELPGLPAGSATRRASTVRVRQDVVVDRAAGPWLTALPRATSVTVEEGGADDAAERRVMVEPVTGSVSMADDRLDGVRYTVHSDVVEPDVGGLSTAGVGTGADARAAVGTVPALPPVVTELQREIFGTAGTPFQQLARLSAFFQNDERVNLGEPFSVDDDAAGGYTVGHIAQLLTPDGARQARPEHFAGAFAVLARAQGFPARLVVGYALPAPPEPGVEAILSPDLLTAWPEVNLQGIGWVPLEFRPDDESDGVVELQEQELDAAVSSAVEESVLQTSPQPGENPNLTAGSADEGTNPLLQVLWVLTALVALLLAVELTPVVRKRRRRTRRRRVSLAADRISGAWLEALDRLTETGVTDVRRLTAAEAVATATATFGPEAGQVLESLGDMVNRAVHSRDAPSDATVDVAWAASDTFAGLLRDQLSIRRRLRAVLDRSPLETGASPPADLVSDVRRAA